MALARVQYQQTVSGTTNFTVPFPYISKDHVKASVDGTDVTFTWVNNNTIKLSTAPAVGAIIDIRRETERVNLLVDFQDASTITEKQLDLATQQSFYIAQEAFDATGGTMAVANDGSYSANNRRISNVGDPNSDDDAANVKYVKGVLSSGYDAYQERLLADAARNKAQQWADNGENVSVETGKYSAKHHATKAAISAANAATSESNAAVSATNASSSANTAATKASDATNSATSAANSATTATNEANRSKTEADRAMGYANGLNLPSGQGNGGKVLRQKTDESGFEYIPSYTAYGLGGAATPFLSNIDSLDTLPGLYYVDERSIGTRVVGETFGVILVERFYTGTNLVQTWTVPANVHGYPKVFLRGYNVSTKSWTSWSEVYHRRSNAVVGQVAFFATPNAPTGWLKCNGAQVSRTAYADLFSVIGTTFGAGDGSTTFSLPDLRGEFLRGWDDGRGADSGRGFGSWQNATRVIKDYWGDGGWSGAVPDVMHLAAADWDWAGRVWDGSNQAYPSWSSGPDGRHVDAMRVRPRNVALLACIKY